MAKREMKSKAPRPTAAASNRAESIAKYDAAYAARKDFIAKPNAFLAQCLKRIAGNRSRRRKRTALDIGIGQGRNAILLVQSGYATTGIDRSGVGIEAARRLAARHGVRFDIVITDTEEFQFGRNRWDVIALLYYPQPMLVMERLRAAVRPGGHIIIERFSRPNHGKSGNVFDRRETKRRNPMLESLSDWHLLLYENDEFTSDWHWNGDSPSGPMVRVLAQKPAGR